VAGLLALVADLLAASRLLGAVARQVAGDTAVVALVAVHAVACIEESVRQDSAKVGART